MPYAVTICSGLSSSNQVCSSDGGITAAPCRMKTMLDRSRCRTSGRAAMRASMVGVAVKVVTRKRSITSRTNAASNFSSTTRWSPPSSMRKVAKPLV